MLHPLPTLRSGGFVGGAAESYCRARSPCTVWLLCAFSFRLAVETQCCFASWGLGFMKICDKASTLSFGAQVSHSNIGLQCQLRCFRISCVASSCLSSKVPALPLCRRGRHSLAIVGFSAQWSWGQHLSTAPLKKLATGAIVAVGCSA